MVDELAHMVDGEHYHDNLDEAGRGGYFNDSKFQGASMVIAGSNGTQPG